MGRWGSHPIARTSTTTARCRRRGRRQYNGPLPPSVGLRITLLLTIALVVDDSPIQCVHHPDQSQHTQHGLHVVGAVRQKPLHLLPTADLGQRVQRRQGIPQLLQELGGFGGRRGVAPTSIIIIVIVAAATDDEQAVHNGPRPGGQSRGHPFQVCIEQRRTFLVPVQDGPELRQIDGGWACPLIITTCSITGAGGGSIQILARGGGGGWGRGGRQIPDQPEGLVALGKQITLRRGQEVPLLLRLGLLRLLRRGGHLADGCLPFLKKWPKLKQLASFLIFASSSLRFLRFFQKAQ